MRLGILCSGHLGLIVLKQLCGKYDIDFVLTDSQSSGILDFCSENGIDVFKGNPRNGNVSRFIENKKANILISINYLFIIDDAIIDFPCDLIFNIHGSLLPKYRGRTPHIWAIINNEKETGITAHIIDKGCDTGDILAQIKIPIKDSDTGHNILLQFQEHYLHLIEKVLNDFEKDKLTIEKQDHANATYFGKRTPEDGEIDWNWQKERIYNWIRAQSDPYPGAFTHINNDKITIDKIAFSDKGYHADMPNGLIVEDVPVLVKTPNGLVELISIRENASLCKKDIIFNKKTI